MNPDDYITGLHDENSPMNRKEVLSEMEEVNILFETLERNLRYSEERSRYQAKLLKEAGGIIEMYRTTGKFKESELNRLTEIFEPYLTN